MSVWSYQMTVRAVQPGLPLVLPFSMSLHWGRAPCAPGIWRKMNCLPPPPSQCHGEDLQPVLSWRWICVKCFLAGSSQPLGASWREVPPGLVEELAGQWLGESWGASPTPCQTSLGQRWFVSPDHVASSGQHPGWMCAAGLTTTSSSLTSRRHLWKSSLLPVLEHSHPAEPGRYLCANFISLVWS